MCLLHVGMLECFDPSWTCCPFENTLTRSSLSDAGWFYGDPHIRTLDGFQYTFNGLGEYTLIETTHGNFTLQGRTAKALDDKGKEMDATIFSAFAAKDIDSDSVHIGMNATRNGIWSSDTDWAQIIWKRHMLGRWTAYINCYPHVEKYIKNKNIWRMSTQISIRPCSHLYFHKLWVYFIIIIKTIYYNNSNNNSLVNI